MLSSSQSPVAPPALVASHSSPTVADTFIAEATPPTVIPEQQQQPYATVSIDALNKADEPDIRATVACNLAKAYAAENRKTEAGEMLAIAARHMAHGYAVRHGHDERQAYNRILQGMSDVIKANNTRTVAEPSAPTGRMQ